jgi:hypothetical protein
MGLWMNEVWSFRDCQREKKRGTSVSGIWFQEDFSTLGCQAIARLLASLVNQVSGSFFQKSRTFALEFRFKEHFSSPGCQLILSLRREQFASLVSRVSRLIVVPVLRVDHVGILAKVSTLCYDVSMLPV